MLNIKTLLLLLIICFSACTELQEFNENTNAPEQVAPQFLLSNVLYQAANNNSLQGWHAGNLLAQHMSNIEFLAVDRYNLGSNTPLWNVTYRLLNDLNTMTSSGQSNEAYEGIAMILKANLGALLTDLWTDVPFFEAIQGVSQSNFTPAFDTQEDIYTAPGGILDLLENAVNILSNTNARVEGDIMYDGDLDQWIKFANALRLRYLLRISSQADVSSDMQAIVSAGNYLQNNADNALIPYLSAAPNQWFIFTEREGRYTDVRMSTTIAGIFDQFDDPREGIFFKPTTTSVNSGTPAYKGLPNGLSRESQNQYELNDISLLGAVLRDIPDGVDALFMKASEVHFILAEAAARGLISGNAADYYATAIEASMEYFGLPWDPDYLNQDAVVLNGNNDLEKILTQKWIASFLNGYEAWLDIRRTGIPQMTISPDNLNQGQYPVRYAYPESEQAVNGVNYQLAVERIGGDNYNSKGWWEQ
ncbi:MAG: SusD/RagB family nutrient-binding outer membrane lipoprotein [Saprospiraceae bacterium]|nr:SusD/RagB family nutrient-binding outer membrane lipoprotein [Lewinella sp.]